MVQEMVSALLPGYGDGRYGCAVEGIALLYVLRTVSESWWSTAG
jgi:hypothetical protein